MDDIASTGRTLVAAAYGGSLWVSHEGGDCWFESLPGPDAPGRAWGPVAVSEDGTRILAAEKPGRLHVSIDGGRNWREARLVGPDMGKYAWRQFVLPVRLPPGNHVLVSRATDVAGNVQPETRGENVSGYNNTSWADHAVKVTVA